MIEFDLATIKNEKDQEAFFFGWCDAGGHGIEDSDAPMYEPWTHAESRIILVPSKYADIRSLGFAWYLYCRNKVWDITQSWGLIISFSPTG